MFAAQGDLCNAVNGGQPVIDHALGQLGQRIKTRVAHQRQPDDRIRVAVAFGHGRIILDIIGQVTQRGRNDLARLICRDIDIGAFGQINGDPARPRGRGGFHIG